jgi:hypothetical protein
MRGPDLGLDSGSGAMRRPGMTSEYFSPPCIMAETHGRNAVGLQSKLLRILLESRTFMHGTICARDRQRPQREQMLHNNHSVAHCLP